MSQPLALTLTTMQSATTRAENEPLTKFSQSRRRPLLGLLLVGSAFTLKTL